MIKPFIRKLIWWLLIPLAVAIGIGISNLFGEEISTIEIKPIQCDICNEYTQIYTYLINKKICINCDRKLKAYIIETIKEYNERRK